MARDSERYPRGSVPLVLSLEEAVEVARRLYENAGGLANADVMSRVIGNSASSSAYIKKVNALRTYGLIEQQGSDFVLTNIGGAIAAPTSPEAEAAAKRDVFLKVEVFAKVFERHKGKLLPADEFLKNLIEQECKIPKELSLKWVEMFKDAAAAIEILWRRPDGKIQIMDAPIMRYPRTHPPEEEATQAPIEAAQPPSKSNNGVSRAFEPSGTGHTTRIELSQRRLAVFSIPDRLTPRDAQKLKSALRGFDSIIDSMISDETEGV